MHTETATFGAGCFWGVEEAFRKTGGVVDTQVGYMGGHTERPSYEDVCTDTTGHAEVVEVTYDPEKISYEALLDIFWRIHDPTQKDGQGIDFGTQYRSVIFYHSDKQKQIAEDALYREGKSDRHSRPLVTEIVPASTFWRAEAYHQRYHEKHGGVC